MAESPNPILVDVPEELLGERVLLRPYRAGDGAALWEAVEESRDHILPWLPWGDTHKTPEDSETFARRNAGKWILREDLSLSIWDRFSGQFLGGTGLHRIDWAVPSFEIGYWLRKSAEGHGYMTEAVRLICRMTFETLKANRVFIRCASRNHRSAAVPRRLGFIHEGTLANRIRDTNGDLCDMMMFAMTPEQYEQVKVERS
jgi:RimJ/RimL family protein N-acetyltransferase